MKITFIFFVSFCLCIIAGDAAAQNQRPVLQVADLLVNADAFVQYRKFRSEFEEMNIELGKSITNPDDYLKLNVAYDDIRMQYNGLLDNVKKDLSDWKAVKNMARRPDNFAGNYLAAYNTVIQAYETNYKPIYEEVLAANPLQSGSKVVPPILLNIGIELFVGLVDLIKSRRQEREASLNAVLGTVNKHFTSKMQMREWADLGIPLPDGHTQNSEGQPSEEQEATDGQPSLGAGWSAAKLSNRGGSYQRPIDVSRPTFDVMKGWVEFNYLGPNRQSARMDFFKTNSKNIGIETLRPVNGQVVNQTAGVSTGFFISTARHGVGTQFQIKVQNTAGMYIFALNSDESVNFLYPYPNETVSRCAESLGLGKDIGILPATPVVGRDRNNVTSLPLPDCSTEPPSERYFTIDGKGYREQLCILLTKSELDIQQVSEHLEAAHGDLIERLAQVFGTAMLGTEEVALLQMSDNRLEFDSGMSEKTVFPVVFIIDKR